MQPQAGRVADPHSSFFAILPLVFERPEDRFSDPGGAISRSCRLPGYFGLLAQRKAAGRHGGSRPGKAVLPENTVRSVSSVSRPLAEIRPRSRKAPGNRPQSALSSGPVGVCRGEQSCCRAARPRRRGRCTDVAPHWPHLQDEEPFRHAQLKPARLDGPAAGGRSRDQGAGPPCWP